ncbi:MAG: hypothetical protein GXO79_12135 [Chlorobi bacterium]|nr:hypothetical protein [Chlorobiota bacterium]
MSNSLAFIKSVLSLHEEMVNNGFTLVYEGEFNHQITKMFTSMAERDMEKVNEEKTLKRRVFHVMVECLQNMTKHSDEFSEDSKIGNGMFIVGKKENAYYIITANRVINEKINDLKNSIDGLNKMNKTELTALYKKQIKEGTLSEKGGAGLGLIDIARKTGQKLDYQFLPLDNEYYFFLLKIKITAP